MEPGTAIAPDLSVSTWTANGVTIAELSGELVTAWAPDLRDGLVRLLQSGSGQIIVDLSRVTDCDDGGLAVLVGVEHRARAAGGFLRLAAAPPPVRQVLGVTGLHLHLDIFPTIQAAISGLGVPADSEEFWAQSSTTTCDKETWQDSAAASYPAIITRSPPVGTQCPGEN